MSFRMKRPKIFDGYPMEFCEKMKCYVCPLREWHRSRHCPAKVKENGLRRGTHPSHTHSLDLNKEYDRLTGANKVDIPTLVREQRAVKTENDSGNEVEEDEKPKERERAKFTASPEQLEEAKKAKLRTIAYRTPTGEEGIISGYMLDTVDLSPPTSSTPQSLKRDGFGRFLSTGKKANKKKKLSVHMGKGGKAKLTARRSCDKSITKKMKEAMLEDTHSETSTDEVIEPSPSASPQKKQLKHTRISIINRDVIEGGTSSSCTSTAASPAHSSTSSSAVHSIIDDIIAQRPFVLPTTVDEITPSFYRDIRCIPYVKRYLERMINTLRENDHRSEIEDNELKKFEEMYQDMPVIPPNLFEPSSP